MRLVSKSACLFSAEVLFGIFFQTYKCINFQNNDRIGDCADCAEHERRDRKRPYLISKPFEPFVISCKPLPYTTCKLASSWCQDLPSTSHHGGRTRITLRNVGIHGITWNDKCFVNHKALCHPTGAFLFLLPHRMDRRDRKTIAYSPTTKQLGFTSFKKRQGRPCKSGRSACMALHHSCLHNTGDRPLTRMGQWPVDPKVPHVHCFLGIPVLE